MREIIATSAILCVQPCAAPAVLQPPLEHQSLAPLQVTLTLGDARWVNAECARILGRSAAPGMVFEACAGIGQPWITMRHGSLYPDQCGAVLAHETGHVRGWNHG